MAQFVDFKQRGIVLGLARLPVRCYFRSAEKTMAGLEGGQAILILLYPRFQILELAFQPIRTLGYCMHPGLSVHDTVFPNQIVDDCGEGRIAGPKSNLDHQRTRHCFDMQAFLKPFQEVSLRLGPLLQR